MAHAYFFGNDSGLTFINDFFNTASDFRCVTRSLSTLPSPAFGTGTALDSATLEGAFFRDEPRLD